MTSIPAGTKFHGVAASVPTSDKKSATLNALSNSYSIEDIVGSATAAPAGNTTEIQYNDNGVFGSDAGFIRIPKGFFSTQAEGGILLAETILGSGDFTEDGGYPIFASGSLYSDDGMDIFDLCGNIENLAGFSGKFIRVQSNDYAGGLTIESNSASLFFEGPTEFSSVYASESGVVLGFQGPTRSVEVSANDNGVQILYDGNLAYTLPLTDGTAGQVLSTDGAGNLSWITP